MTDKAAALFEAFHEGKVPDDADLPVVELKGPIQCLVVGELDGVIYRLEGVEEPFVHHFAKSNRPVLVVSEDGRLFFPVGGNYRFTERGFVG